MLERLLHEIQDGGTLEAGVLATRLGTSPQIVVAMLDHLERLGKLQDLAQCSDVGCTKCSLTGTCSVEKGKGARIWQVRK